MEALTFQQELHNMKFHELWAYREFIDEYYHLSKNQYVVGIRSAIVNEMDSRFDLLKSKFKAK